MPTTPDTDRIEKEIVMKAPRAKVWRALTEPAQFGKWFGAEMKGPFAPGVRALGKITSPGYEHMTLDMTIERMEPERLFSWRWHPHAVDPAHDYSGEPTTLVECELSDVPGGTRLRIVESGFDRVPLARRAEAFRMNSDGWAAELQNIARHLGEKG
jgi:uncharacterized protein YndB with AHSA1/START domain